MKANNLLATAALIVSLSCGIAFFHAVPGLNPLAADPTAPADVGAMLIAAMGAAASALTALHGAINDADARGYAQRIRLWLAQEA